MRKNNVFGALIALAMCAGISTADSSPKPVDIPMAPGSDVDVFSLTAVELAHHSEAALAGDADSGTCLANYYSFLRFNDPRRNYWITIAAENGSGIAMLMLAFYLENSHGQDDHSRASFWRKRAVSAKSAMHPNCRFTAKP